MKCNNCGREVEEGKVFCPSCGKEIQIVPDYNAFEDDLLRELMEEDQEAHKQASTSKIQKTDSQKKLRQEQAKKKKLIMLASISIAVILLITAIIIAIAVNKSNQANSFDYQFEKGHQAFTEQDYKTAIEYYEKAIKLDAKDVTVKEELLQCYMKLGTEDDYNAAIVLCADIIDLDPANELAYSSLIQIYDQRGDYEEIAKLAKDVTEPDILNLFTDYIATAPIFSIKGGDYDNITTISLSAASGCTIYYTTDGSDPEKNGTVYEKSIVLDKSGETEIKAVCKNEKGLYSDIVSETYNLTFSAPEMPVVSPDGGTFDSADTLITIEVPDDCVAYYTWDGTTPDVNSSLTSVYTEPIPVQEGNNILTVVIYNEKLKMLSPIYRGNFIYHEE